MLPPLLYLLPCCRPETVISEPGPGTKSGLLYHIAFMVVNKESSSPVSKIELVLNLPSIISNNSTEENPALQIEVVNLPHLSATEKVFFYE